MKLAVSLVATLSLLSIACAYKAPVPNPVGTWQGRLHAHFNPPRDAAQGSDASTRQANLAKIKKSVEDTLNKMRITLVLKKDHTYAAKTMRKDKTEKSVGKWKQKGRTVTLIPSDATVPKRVGTLSANGKVMTAPLPKDISAHGITGIISFAKT